MAARGIRLNVDQVTVVDGRGNGVGRNGDHGGLVRGQREFKGCVAFTGREDGGRRTTGRRPRGSGRLQPASASFGTNRLKDSMSERVTIMRAP